MREGALRHAGLAAVLALAAALAGWGLTWGLPAEHGWAPDEVLPADVDAAVARRFASGWHSKYPPLHFAVLAAATAPVRLVGGHDARMVAGRVVSLVMGLGAVIALHAAARRLAGPRAALLAAALFATSVPFVFYAKTANLDVPYVFWFSLAFLAWVRFQEGGRLRDGAAFALAALGALALLLLDNVLFNPSGFAAHLRLITGPASRDFRMFPATSTGELRLFVETARHLAFALGWPGLLAAAAGLAAALRSRPRPYALLATLAFPVSYLLFFLAVVGYVYDRFLLPVALVLSPFAGLALDRAWSARRRLGPLLAAAVLGVSLVRAVGVDRLLVGDARYAAEDWLRREAGTTSLVAAVGPLEYLPRLQGLRWRRLGPAAARLQAVRPDFVVVNADYAARAEDGTGERAFYAGLADGTFGYTLAYRHRAAPKTPLLGQERLRGEGPGRIWSNLDKADPEIRVYRRVR